MAATCICYSCNISISLTDRNRISRFIWSFIDTIPLIADSTLVEIRFIPKICGLNINGIRVGDTPVRFKAVTLSTSKEIVEIPVRINTVNVTIDNCLTLEITPNDKSVCEGDTVPVSYTHLTLPTKA